jgi:hypothetical protein
VNTPHITTSVKKRLGLVLIAGTLASAVMPGVASAEPVGIRPPFGPPEVAEGPPAGGCPTVAGWRLVTPSGPGHLSAAYDHNGDGQVCLLLVPAGPMFMDNVVR